MKHSSAGIGADIGRDGSLLPFCRICRLDIFLFDNMAESHKFPAPYQFRTVSRTQNEGTSKWFRQHQTPKMPQRY